MRKPLYSWLKRLFSDAHSAIIGIILVSLLAGGTGIYLFLKNLWNELIKIVQFQIPLWATIALVLLSGGYVYLRTRRIHASSTPKEIMFECRNLKWKIIVKSNSDYKVEFMPYCIIHDKMLVECNDWYACQHENKEYGCSYIKIREHKFLYEIAKSEAEHIMRNKLYQKL